jgi:hypothetical protein
MKMLLFVFSLTLLGCSDDNFRKVEQLDSFRILGIEADNPEVAPGGTANLRLFVSDPSGPAGGRVIEGEAVSCIDLGISAGAPVSCDHDPSRVTSTYTIDTTAPDLLNNLYTGYSGSLTVNIPAFILTGRSVREKHNGVAYIVIFNFIVDGRKVSAFKRVIATERGTFNSNPTTSTILLNGVPFTGRPQNGDRVRLNTSVPETYTYINVDGSTENRIEEKRVAWFVSGAEFDKPKVSLSEEAKLTMAPPSEPYLIVAIVRDDRGGMEVVRINVP